MCKMQCVLALVAMYVGFVHSWDIAVSLGDELIFYTNGSKTGTERFKSQNLTAIAYDEIHNMMLYVDKQIDNDAICGYNLHSKEKKCFIKRVGGYIHSIAYDLATEKLFFTDTNERSINWISLKPGSNNNVNGNLLIKLDVPPSDIGVDSWSGYIYWSYLEKGNETYMERLRFNGSAREVLRNKTYMERVRFNGSDREVLKTWLSIFSFAMDPQTRKMYYFDGCEDCYYEFLARDDFNGKNVYRHYSNRHLSAPKELTVSKDYIYFMNGIESNSTVWQIPKNFSKDEEPKAILKFYDKSPLGIAANYKIIDQFHGVQDCEVVWSLLGKIYERCDVCEKYCLQGDCSINDEGLPNCRCNAGYSGKRCEVYACHGYCLNNGNCSLNEKNQPVCQCKGEYVGDRCEVADCLKYCIKGKCSFNKEGLPTCSCNAGYSGERCEVYACHGYCQNNGNCSLNENSEPVCQCKGEYVGDRCEVADCLNYCIKGECSFNEEGLPTCSCNAGYSGERCEVYACHGYCQNNGNCSLNENSEPVCQCKREYVGDRCEVADCLNYCIKGECSFNEEGLPTCSCNAGYSGERCEVYACHGYCLNKGICTLNEEDEPFCQCVDNHDGVRCEAAINDTFTNTPLNLVKRNLTLADLLSSWRKPTSKIFVTVEV